MTVKIRQTPLEQDMLSHNRDLLLGLSRAAQTVQQAGTADEIYHAIGGQIKSLGGEVTLLMVNNDRQSLTAVYMSYVPKLLRQIEKLTGVPAMGYRIAFSPESVYARDIAATKAKYVRSAKEHFFDALPKTLHPVTGQLMNILKIEQGILAPLHIEGETLGLMMVSGLSLNEGDVPAMESFAGQIAAGLRNVRLMQKLQDELSARKRVEESLNHSRNLLLALSRAAQAVQQARSEEEIYQAVGEQIKSLGHEVIILTVTDEKQYLNYAYSTFSKSVIETGEKLTGLSIQNYRFFVSPESNYGRILRSGRGGFDHWTTNAIAEALPKALRSMAGQLARLLKIEHSVIAPLSVNNKLFGTLTVASSSVTEEDITAIESFAAQVAISLHNARLAKQMQDELSARRQAEEAIRQTERHFKSLIEKAPDGIVLVGSDGTTNYVSPSARNIFGYDLDDGINANPLEFIHPDDLAIVLSTMNDLIQNPAYTPTVKYRYKHKDDSYHWVESTFSNLLAEPSVQAVVINFRDITGRKQTEEALKQSEARYRLLADHTTDTIWMTDLNLKTIYISPSVEKVRGFTLEQLQELPLEQNITSASFQSAMEVFTTEIPKVYADPNYLPVHTLELEFFTRDGQIYSTETKLSIIRDENGNPISILGESRDIAERKRIEKALHESERYYRALIENATDGILVVNADGKIRYESPSVARMLGYDPDALIGTSAFDLINPDDLAPIASAFMEGLNIPGFIHRGEYLLRHCSGEWRYFEIISRYLMGDPVIAGIIINGRDITDRKRAEDALRESESKFHSVITESADGIVLSDESGCIIEFNNAFEQMTGQKHEMVLGQFLWNLQFNMAPRQLRTDEYHAMIKEAIQKALETGQSSFIHKIMEVPFEHLDGSLRFIQQRIFSIRTEKGWRLGSISRDITEQKRTEEALRASEENFKSLYQMLRLMTDNLPDLVWAKDMEGRYIFANKAITEKLLIAQDTEEPIGKTDLYFAKRQRASHPENSNWHTFGELCMDSDSIVHAKKHAERFEEFGNVKGRFLFLDVYKAPFLNEQGNMIGTVGIGRDVTHEKKLEEERQQVQDALAASEAELRALFSSMQDTVLVIDRDGVYRKIAPTNPDKLYISPEKVIGHHLTDFFPAEQVEKFLGVMRQVLETQQTLQIQYELVINGEAPWFEASISPMGDDCTLWVARDISERKQAEAALIQSEQAYRTLFENMPIGLYRTSADGRILNANPALVNMFGCPDRSSMLEKNAQDLYADPTSNDRFKSEISKRGIISAFEAEFRRNDQATFWAEDYAHVIYDKAGRTLYYEGSLINITNRKQAEDELRRANKSLEDTHSELQQMFAHEQVLARTDGMTGLYNRRYFFELAAREFSAAIRYQRPLTIILFDIDGFKQVNDTFGHAMGDTLLIQVAQATATQVRDVDILARYGGDEFIILLPQTGVQQAFLIAERIRESVAATRMETDNDPIIVTLSLGVAETIHTPHDASVEDAIRRADKALYTAKQKGRNNTAIFSDD